MNKERFPFIEGLRGIAALIVVLAHCCSTFYPFFARVGQNSKEPWETALMNTPVFTLVDGSDAVMVFFLMSGFVLAGSFLSSSLRPGQQIVKRFVRLYIPVACSVLLAVCIYSVSLPKDATALVTQSVWAKNFWPTFPAASEFFNDLFASSMLTGYRGVSVFDPFAWIYRPSLSASLNLPLWSLHMEFWGSLLLIAVCWAYRHLNKAIFWILYAVAVLWFGSRPMGMFLWGFGIYLFRNKLSATSMLGAIAGIGAVFLGVVLTYKTWGAPVDQVQAIVAWLKSSGFPVDWRSQGMIAAALIFVGSLLSPWVRSALSKRPFLWLGRVSFSLYLVHFPILVGVGGPLFLALQDLGYGIAVAITTGAVISVGLAVATIFEKIVDRTAIRWSSLPRRPLTLPPGQLS